MRHDSLRQAEVWREDGFTMAILPEDFILWEGTGSWLSRRRLPDQRLIVAVEDDVLAERVVDVIADMEEGKGGGDTRASALIILLAGEDRMAEAVSQVQDLATTMTFTS